MDANETGVSSPTLDDLITSTPDVMSGAWVFRGTRVMIEAHFENLAGGMTLDEILDNYPSLNRDEIIQVPELKSGDVARKGAFRAPRSALLLCRTTIWLSWTRLSTALRRPSTTRPPAATSP
jgi:uncharacterized protein (DUF433 family)